MKIGYFGDGPWACHALEKIMATPEFAVVFIVPRYENPDLTLKSIAEEYEIPFIENPDVNTQDFLNIINKFHADIFVSMSFNQILKLPIINYTDHGFINCHAGALPFYRGRNILNWALINGEKYFGITVHYVDEGIDTGDIMLQKFVEIDKSDNYKSVLQKSYHECSSLLLEALLLIYNDNVKRIKQSTIHPVGFYCGKRIDGDEWIDWKWTSKRIHNFVRALSRPGPCARTYKGQDILAIIETEPIINAPDYIGTCGEVVGKDSKGIVVKTGDNTIRIKKVADVINGNQIVNEKTPSCKIGTRFGINIYETVKELENEIKKIKKENANQGW